MTASRMEKHLMEISPFRLGSRVRVAPSFKYSGEWKSVYVVTGLRWEYQKGPDINIEIAGDDDIERGCGATDGFRVADLEPVI